MQTDLYAMTISQLIIAESMAVVAHDYARAELANRLRWEKAMGSVINTQSTGHKPRRRQG